MKPDAEIVTKPVDPTCLFHGMKMSEHKEGWCIYCPLCFKSGDYERFVDSSGQMWDICVECKAHEDLMMR